MELLIALIVVCVIASIALWAIARLAPPDLQQPLKILVIAFVLIYLIVRLWPFLGATL